MATRLAFFVSSLPLVPFACEGLRSFPEFMIGSRLGNSRSAMPASCDGVRSERMASSADNHGGTGMIHCCYSAMQTIYRQDVRLMRSSPARSRAQDELPGSS